MRFLCICQYGHSRSVAMCRAIHAKGHEAVAVGYGTSPTALQPLAQWADKIVILDQGCNPHRPELCMAASKVVQFPIGADIWSNPYNVELRAKCEEFRDTVLRV